MGFLRKRAARSKQRFTRSEVYFLLIASSLAVVSTCLHEVGHALACMFLGLEILEFSCIAAMVKCTPVPDGPHILSRLAGGTFAAILFSVPLAVGGVRRAKHAKYALFVVITAQAANAVLETLTYEAYIVFGLANWVIAVGAVGMILAIVFCGSLREPPAGRPDPRRDGRHQDRKR